MKNFTEKHIKLLETAKNSEEADFILYGSDTSDQFDGVEFEARDWILNKFGSVEEKTMSSYIKKEQNHDEFADNISDEDKLILQKNLELQYKKEAMPAYLSESAKQLQGIKFRREKRDLLGKISLEVRKSFILKNPGVPEWFVDQTMDKWSNENLTEKKSEILNEEELDFNIDFNATNIPTYRWLVKDLGLCAGAVNFLVGKMEKGKTMLAQHLGVCVATGSLFLGQYPVEQGGVVHLDFDRNGRTNTYIRYLRIAKALKVKPNCIKFATLQYKMDSLEFDYDGNGVREYLTKLMTGNKLIIIDSLSAGTEGDENDANIRKPLDMVSDISEKTGCMALIIAHSGHNDGDHMIRGSSAIGQAAGQIFGVRSKDGSCVYNVSLEKGRIKKDIDPFSYKMEDDGKPVEQWGKKEELHFLHNGAAESSDESGYTAEEKILIALEGTTKDKPMKLAGIDGLEKTVGGNTTKFGEAKKKLLEDGKIFEIKIGKANAYHI